MPALAAARALSLSGRLRNLGVQEEVELSVRRLLDPQAAASTWAVTWEPVLELLYTG
jgi:hypothetical protein